MEQRESILDGYSDREKGAYLAAIASIATADREASEEELEHLTALAQAADLSEEQQEMVRSSATGLSSTDLQQSLDVLKNSELKHSLIADMIAFSKSDSNYSESEQQSVQKMATYLGVNGQQFALLDEFAENASAQQGNAQGIFDTGGLGGKMQAAGINTNGLLKSILTMAAPFLISRMLNRRGGGGMFGGTGGGGMFGGGGGGMFGGNAGMGGMGGLGSLIGMLNGGRGMGSAGGLLGKVLGGRF